MRQALHILRKDILYLWIEIAAALVAIGIFIFTASYSTSEWNSPLPRTVASFIMQFLLPFAWWTLITRAVHAEPLIGDRQFWPTRPYAWRSLLGAKAMLFLLFVNVPMLLAQSIILAIHGFSPLHELPGLLWSQVLLTGFVVLPIATIACVTASVVQFLVICLVTFIAALLLSLRFMLFASAIVGGGWGPMEWIHTSYSLLVIVIAAPAVLAWQYARRQTLAVRALAAGAILVFLVGAPITWSTGFALQSRVSRHAVDAAGMRVGMNSGFAWMVRALVEREGSVSIHVPLQIEGAAENLTVQPEALELAIEGSGGAAWHAPAEPRGNITRTGQLISIQTRVDGSFYRKVKDQPVRLRGYLYATLYGNRRVYKVPFTGRPNLVAGLGRCTATSGLRAPYFLQCNSAFLPPPDLVTVKFEEYSRFSINYVQSREPPSFSPFPAQFSLDPVSPYIAYSTYRDPLDAVTITTLEPLSHVRIPLAIDGLRLGDYEKIL